MLGLMERHYEPIDYTLSGYTGVLDLRTSTTTNTHNHSNITDSGRRPLMNVMMAESSEEDCSRSWCSSSPPPIVKEECEPHQIHQHDQNNIHLQNNNNHHHQQAQSQQIGSPLSTSSTSLTPPPPPSQTPPNLPLVSTTLAITQRVLQRTTRPFKAYPKDPVFLADGQDKAYLEFRQQMLAQVRNQKNHHHTSTTINNNNNNNISNNNNLPTLNSRKRAQSPQQHPTSSGSADSADAAYWERRRKNNEAAKRSRDARRAKEDEIAIRAAFLEQENLKLKYQIAALTDETTKLKCMLYKSEPLKHSPFTPLHLDTRTMSI